jgi:hypothetical protein
MRPIPLAALALAALLAAGCGDILRELDTANDLASTPSGNKPPPAGANPGAKPAPGAAPAAAPAAATPGAPAAAATKPPGAAPEAPKEPPGLIAQILAWVGLGGAPKDSRRPPDPNDPMVSCRLGGSLSFMLKSGCINRRGTVIASKGVPH